MLRSLIPVLLVVTVHAVGCAPPCEPGQIQPTGTVVKNVRRPSPVSFQLSPGPAVRQSAFRDLPLESWLRTGHLSRSAYR